MTVEPVVIETKLEQGADVKVTCNLEIMGIKYKQAKSIFIFNGKVDGEGLIDVMDRAVLHNYEMNAELIEEELNGDAHNISMMRALNDVQSIEVVALSKRGTNRTYGVVFRSKLVQMSSKFKINTPYDLHTMYATIMTMIEAHYSTASSLAYGVALRHRLCELLSGKIVAIDRVMERAASSYVVGKAKAEYMKTR